MTVSPAARWVTRPSVRREREFVTPWLRCGVVPRMLRPGASACVLAVMLGAGCGSPEVVPRDGMAPDTARFTYGDRTVEVALTACGREGDVVVLAGVTAGIVLQVEADLGDGGLERTGVTADLGEDGIVGAFGADMGRAPAGEITDVRAVGDRLVVDGTWVAFDDQLVARQDASAGVDGRLVARCPENGPEDAPENGPDEDAAVTSG